MMKVSAVRRWQVFSRLLVVASIGACGGAGGGASGSATSATLTFEQALVTDSFTYEPPTAFRAVAENDWARAAVTGSVAGAVVEGTRWKLDDSCEVQFTKEADALAANESAPLQTRKLAADACRGHTGFWQMSAGRG